MRGNLKIEDRRVIVKVPKSLYSEDSIDKTIDIFQDNFKIEKKQKKESCLIVIFSDFDVDFEKVGLEFFNFLLKNERSEFKI